MQASQIRAHIHGGKEKGGDKVKQETLYCNICGAKIKGGESTASKMWCSRCYGERRNALDRIYTRDTVYLVCKRHAEGMSVKDIALLLKRSEENVQRALDEGSKDPRIAAKYTPYLIPKPPGKQKHHVKTAPEQPTKQKHPKPPKRYNVYDKIDKQYIIKNGTTYECAQALGITTQSFYYHKNICVTCPQRTRYFIQCAEDTDNA